MNDEPTPTRFPMNSITGYGMAKAAGVRIGPRIGDYLDRRQLVDVETGEVLHDRGGYEDVEALYADRVVTR